MTHFIISLADIPIEVKVEYEETMSFCRNFLANTTPQLSVTVGKEDLEAERSRALKSDGKNINCSFPYLETLALYRKITAALVHHNVLLMHGAVISMDGNGFLFTAPSGTGKTTHISLWKQVYGDRVTVINGDKPLLKVTANGVTAYGTPWRGKEELGCNSSVPLCAVCHLNRGTENRMEKSGFTQMLPVLLQQTHRPADSAGKMAAVELVNRMQDLRYYKLWCNMDPEAAVVCYEGMKG